MAGNNQLHHCELERFKNGKDKTPSSKTVLDVVKRNHGNVPHTSSEVSNDYINCLARATKNQREVPEHVVISLLHYIVDYFCLEKLYIVAKLCQAFQFSSEPLMLTILNVSDCIFSNLDGQVWQIKCGRIMILTRPLLNEDKIISIEKETGCFIHKQEIRMLRKTTYALEKHIKEKNELINEQEIKFHEENNALKERIKEKDDIINEQKIGFNVEKNEFLDKIKSLENKVDKLEKALEKLKVEHEESLFEFGKLSVERAANINETKKAKVFETLFHLNQASVSIVRNENDNGSTSTSGTNSSCHEVQHFPSDSRLSSNEGSHNNSHVSCNSSPPEQTSIVTEDGHRPAQYLLYAVQEEEPRESISLSSEPHSSVTADMYNAYKLLLLTVSYSLLFSDILELKNWANEQFSVETSLSAMEILFQLDRKEAFNALDLSSLVAFFESILRHDLVHLIESYCSGDYAAFKRLVSVVNSRKQSRNRSRVTDANREYLPRVVATNTNVDRNVSNARGLERATSPNNSLAPSNGNNEYNTGHLNTPPANVRVNRSSARVNTEVVADCATHVNSGRGNSIGAASCDTPKSSTARSTDGMSGSTRSSTKTSSIQNHHSKCNHGPSDRHPGNHSQGAKTEGPKNEKWLCNHYKRHCFVNFDCCSTFYPCHRCHNSESTCGRDKLKSRNTKMVKCAECGKEQQFGEACIQCNQKFADFYCGKCKHLTGLDDFPYHCEKCGICRIHGDRSFHCDVCGVCLDVQLRDNHKCRPDSAHDECCICLEDAFTGCQILPCSHKVHKNCATRMIQSGITRCPICRESFAHKLERRPLSKRVTRKNERKWNRH